MSVRKTNEHHVLFTEANWKSTPEARCLREDSNLIIKFDEGVHVELHKICSAIPLLGEAAMELIANRYSFHGLGSLDKIDQLLFAINSEVYDRELADEAIDCLESQIPFIKEGAVDVLAKKSHSLPKESDKKLIICGRKLSEQNI